MGTIEKRGKNSWRIGERLPTDQGRKWIRRTVTFPAWMTEKEQRHQAELELARLTLDTESGKAAPQQELTVRALADIWLTQHVDVNLKPTTAKTYRNLIESRILPVLGDRPVSKLKPLELTRFFVDLHNAEKLSTSLPPDQRKRKSDRSRPAEPKDPLSDKTVRHIYDVLNYMLNKGVKWELIRANPLSSVDRPRVRKKRMHYLDDDQAVELIRLLQGEKPTFRCAVLLALLCGLRLSEVCGLKFSDVNWKKKTISISRGLNYTPQKGNYLDTPKSDAADRVISLPDGMLQLLAEILAGQQRDAALIGDAWHGDGRIICAWDGSPLHHDTPSKQFRVFAKKHGFEDLRSHDLRHTHATLLFASNIDAVAVASRLGHAKADTTLRIYAHALKRRDEDSAAAMQSILDRVDAAPADDAQEDEAPVN